MLVGVNVGVGTRKSTLTATVPFPTLNVHGLTPGRHVEKAGSEEVQWSKTEVESAFAATVISCELGTFGVHAVVQITLWGFPCLSVQLTWTEFVPLPPAPKVRLKTAATAGRASPTANTTAHVKTNSISRRAGEE